MCALLIGPVEDIGHPFPAQRHEIPRRRVIGDSIVYSFGRPFLYEPIGIEPEEPIEAVAVWDPCWLRLDPDKRGEIERLRALATQFNAPLVGLFGDWFAGWRSIPGFATPEIVQAFDAVVTDAAGAATIRDHTDFSGTVVATSHMLTYGRLPTLGDDPGGVANAATERHREIDVCCISYAHASVVWQRPFYLDLVRRLCDQKGWTCVIRADISAAHMETLYLRSRVVFNCSLGSQLNCRAYEALACGCHLLTDGWNLEASTLPPGVALYHRPEQLEEELEILLRAPPDATKYLPWVLAHGPQETWKRNLDAIRMAATSGGFSPRGKAAPSGQCLYPPKLIRPSQTPGASR